MNENDNEIKYLSGKYYIDFNKYNVNDIVTNTQDQLINYIGNKQKYKKMKCSICQEHYQDNINVNINEDNKLKNKFIFCKDCNISYHAECLDKTDKNKVKCKCLFFGSKSLIIIN